MHDLVVCEPFAEQWNARGAFIDMFVCFVLQISRYPKKEKEARKGGS